MDKDDSRAKFRKHRPAFAKDVMDPEDPFRDIKLGCAAVERRRALEWYRTAREMAQSADRWKGRAEQAKALLQTMMGAFMHGMEVGKELRTPAKQKARKRVRAGKKPA